MRFADFDEGFRAEYANRVFARVGMAASAVRTRSHESGPFWTAYARLEEFNADVYARASTRMRIPDISVTAARRRGWIVGLIPNPLRRESIRFAFPRTVEHAEDLHRLAALGPESERVFLDYMVRQEELQVQLMEKMLRRRYEDCIHLVDDFLAGARSLTDG